MLMLGKRLVLRERPQRRAKRSADFVDRKRVQTDVDVFRRPSVVKIDHATDEPAGAEWIANVADRVPHADALDAHWVVRSATDLSQSGLAAPCCACAIERPSLIKRKVLYRLGDAEKCNESP